MDFNVDPSEKVTRLAAVIVHVLLAETIAGKESVVNAAKDGATAPVIFASDVKVTVVADAHTGENPAPNVVKAGKLNVVNVAAVSPKAPTTLCKLVNVNVVNAARVGLKVPPTEVNDGIFTVDNDVAVGAKFVPMAINAGILKVVKALAVKENGPPIPCKLVNVNVVNELTVPVKPVPPGICVNAGRFIVVSDAAVIINPLMFTRDGKLKVTKRGVVTVIA